MILANAAGLPREPGKGPNQPDPNPFRRLLYKYHFPYGYFENFYQRTWHDPSKAPDELVRQYYDMARRVGAQEEGSLSLQQYRTGDPETVLGRITQPVLLLWSQSQILPSDESQRFINLPQERRSGVPRLRESGPYPADRGRSSVRAGRACLPGSAGKPRKRVGLWERGQLALVEGGAALVPRGDALVSGLHRVAEAQACLAFVRREDHGRQVAQGEEVARTLRRAHRIVTRYVVHVGEQAPSFRLQTDACIDVDPRVEHVSASGRDAPFVSGTA